MTSSTGRLAAVLVTFSAEGGEVFEQGEIRDTQTGELLLTVQG